MLEIIEKESEEHKLDNLVLILFLEYRVVLIVKVLRQ